MLHKSIIKNIFVLFLYTLLLFARHAVAQELEQPIDNSKAELESLSFGDCQPSNICQRIQPSDNCFSEFVSPMTNTIYFEDPRNLTEARLIYLNNSLPPLLGGGDISLIACQFRAALTERLSIIVTKNGFITYDRDIPYPDDGWADVSGGLKYMLYANPENQTLLSTGLVFELPVGSTRALQGNGDGEFDLFLSGGKQLGCRSHYVTATGLRLPADRQSENQVFYWSQHLDYQILPSWYVLTEFNYYHYMSDISSNFIGSVNGLDLYNFGASDVVGNDILTWAFGLKKKFGKYNELGAAYEIPVTNEKDILGSRLTFDVIVRY